MQQVVFELEFEKYHIKMINLMSNFRNDAFVKSLLQAIFDHLGFSVSSEDALKISSRFRSLRRVLEIKHHRLKRPQMVIERTKIDFLRNHQK
jgi:hypothetical protein